MTAINAIPRPVQPPRRTTARRSSLARPLPRRRALSVAVTVALLAGTSMAIDVATSTASAANPTSSGAPSRPIGTSQTRLPEPSLGPSTIGPALLHPGSSI
jgi:hypothetical protein